MPRSSKAVTADVLPRRRRVSSVRCASSYDRAISRGFRHVPPIPMTAFVSGNSSARRLMHVVPSRRGSVPPACCSSAVAVTSTTSDSRAEMITSGARVAKKCSMTSWTRCRSASASWAARGGGISKAIATTLWSRAASYPRCAAQRPVSVSSRPRPSSRPSTRSSRTRRAAAATTCSRPSITPQIVAACSVTRRRMSSSASFSAGSMVIRWAGTSSPTRMGATMMAGISPTLGSHSGR